MIAWQTPGKQKWDGRKKGRAGEHGLSYLLEFSGPCFRKQDRLKFA
jgi:hypothetical protein